MRALFATIFGVLFCLSQAPAQVSVPIFPSRKDSAEFALTQTRLDNVRKQAAEHPLGTKAYDSLMAVHSELMKAQMHLLSQPGLIMRTVYRSDPMMTSYAQMVRNRKPDQVSRLSILGNGRTQLPDSLYLCTNLEELELVNWKLKKLPRKLNKLERLREVTFLNNQPSGSLKLSRNNSIKELNFRGDEGKRHLPKRYSALRNLETLDLSRNNLSQFPNLAGSKNLKKVVLLYNDITLEDLHGRQPSSIVELNLANNKIKYVPASIGKFTSVKKLNFNNNQVDSVSPAISALKNLEELSFYKNRLSTFPEAIYTLPNLRVIDLYYNDIAQVDARIGQMQSLEILYLANNKFYTLPENLGQLSHLRELYLHHNRLSNLPESVGQMQQLTVLRVNDNQLLEFPPALHHLSELQNLDISHNQIQAIAMNDLSSFRNLKILSLVGNPWDEPTREALPAFALRLRQNKTVVHLNSFTESLE